MRGIVSTSGEELKTEEGRNDVALLLSTRRDKGTPLIHTIGPANRNQPKTRERNTTRRPTILRSVEETVGRGKGWMRILCNRPERRIQEAAWTGSGIAQPESDLCRAWYLALPNESEKGRKWRRLGT